MKKIIKIQNALDNDSEEKMDKCIIFVQVDNIFLIIDLWFDTFIIMFTVGYRLFSILVEVFNNVNHGHQLLITDQEWSFSTLILNGHVLDVIVDALKDMLVAVDCCFNIGHAPLDGSVIRTEMRGLGVLLGVIKHLQYGPQDLYFTSLGFIFLMPSSGSLLWGGLGYFNGVLA